MPCSYCAHYLSVNSLRVDVLNYHNVRKIESSKGLHEESRATFEPNYSLASERVKKEIFPKLQIDEVSSVIKRD